MRRPNRRSGRRPIFSVSAAEKAASGPRRSPFLAARAGHLTRQLFSAQEDERHKSSHQLQDEIAQLLLGINVRLLTLRKAAKAGAGTFKKEIASTQRLVGQSVRTTNRFAHEFSLHHET